MKKLLLLFCVFISTNFLFSQINYTCADMENIILPIHSDPTIEPNRFLDGQPNQGNYTWTSGNCEFRCHYGASWDRGFAVSNYTDSINATFNYYYLYASKPLFGGPMYMTPGSTSSPNYLVVSSLYPAVVKFIVPSNVITVNVSNAFYTTVVMRDGDGLNNIPKFGGISGNDSDWFKIVFKKYLGGVLYSDSVEHYLAEYNFHIPGLHYVQDGWQQVDISALGFADSLQMVGRASNAIANYYSTNMFCVDNLLTDNGPLSVKDNSLFNIKVYPNPTNNILNIDLPFNPKEINLYNDMGECVLSTKHLPIHIEKLKQGIYTVRVYSENPPITKKVIISK